MSTDQYPEVRGEDSGLVPPQSAKGEWPKKIRTLTAAELDRLTIDAEGRFLWDGKPVVYEKPVGPSAPAQHRSDDSLDRSALDILDRAALELADPKAAQAASSLPDFAQQPAAEPGTSITSPELAEQIRAAEAARPADEYPQAATGPAVFPEVRPSDATQPVVYAAAGTRERVRLSLSFWQSLAVFFAILGLLVAAAGLAASGLVAVHSWACQTKVTDQYCPPPPPAPPAPPVRPEIPA